MNPQVVYRVWKTAGLTPDSTSEENRIKLQKLAYIADYLGIPVGFNVTMFLYGPYDAQIADLYYEEDVVERVRSAESIAGWRGCVLKHISELSARELEILATALYYRRQGKDMGETAGIVSHIKPVEPEHVVYLLGDLDRWIKVCKKKEGEE